MSGRIFRLAINLLTLALFCPYSTVHSSLKSTDIGKVSQAIKKEISKTNKWPDIVQIGKQNLKVTYTFNEKLESFIKSELKRYGSDYASVVVIDNATGNILTAIDYEKKKKKFGVDLTLSSSHPAASIFKIVTAAELIENSRVSKESLFRYIGRSTTLYKHQLADKYRKYKWTRTQSLERAFAVSNNVIFGKAAIQNIVGLGIFKMATDFGFNEDLGNPLIEKSIFEMPESQYDLAQLASGLNKRTMMSPVHGALIASVIANEGTFIWPNLISKLVDLNDQSVNWAAKVRKKAILTKESTDELMEMMELTLKNGTARKSFRRYLNKFPLKEIKVGGKTGAMTGGNPLGKRDWFVAYALPESDSAQRGISLCVMIVNVKKWHVKSSYLGKRIIEYYFKNVNPLNV